MMARESSFCDENHSSQLSQLLHQQKERGDFCDVTMRVCEREIYAHSNVLAGVSAYFNAFLSQDLPRFFSQKSPQIIEIQIDGNEPGLKYAEAVEAVIDFMYTGNLKVSESNVAQVAEIARIMQVDPVVTHCEDFVNGVVKLEDRNTLPKKKGVDEGTITESSFLVDMAINRSGGKTNKAPSNNRFQSLVSVSTQVVPKMLGLRDSEREMDDKGVNTDHDESMPARSLMLIKKRGRPRKQPKEFAVEVIADQNEEMSIDMLTEALEDVEGVERGETAVNASVDVDLSVDAYSSKNAEGLGSSRDISNPTADKGEVIVTGMSSCREAMVTGMSSCRRSSRKAKPKVFEDFAEFDVSPKKRIKQEKDSGEKSESPKEDVKEQVATDETSSHVDEPQQSLIDLAAAAETVEREKEDIDHGDTTEGVSDQGEDDSETEIEKLPEQKLWKKVKVEREYKQRPGGKFQCEQCSYGTNSVKEFGGHIKKHKMEQKICYYCDMQFTQTDDLLTHMETHKGPEPFHCTVCDARFKVRTLLNTHMPKHSTERPFICETCSMGFKWKHALKAHMVVHSNRKDHLCDICGYATAHKNQLTSHKRIHTGMTLKCPYEGCTFQALKTQNMKYHLLTHSAEKPHQCEFCGQAFSLKKNMKRHMLMHSAEGKKDCDHCDFTSPRVDKLKEHLLKQHGIGTPPEKRLRVSDLVAQASGQQVLPVRPKSAPKRKREKPKEEDKEEAAAKQDDTARFIIEYEADGTTQQVEISPGHILVTPSGTEHVLSGQGLNEIAALGLSEGLRPASVTLTEGGEVLHAGDEMLVASNELGEVQYTEVMIPSDAVIPGFVQQVSYDNAS